MNTQRISVWAKVKIVAEIESDSNGDDLVNEVCAEIVDITKLKTAELGNLINSELTIVIPEKIEIHDQETQTTYFRDIDISEWADSVFGGAL
jgi:hypothetical protein